MSGSVQWTEITSLVDYTICGPQIKLVLDGPCWSVAAENLKKIPKIPTDGWLSQHQLGFLYFLSCMPSVCRIIVCTQYCTALCMNIIIQYVQIKLRPMGIHHSPHTHPTPIPMGIPIPTAALKTVPDTRGGDRKSSVTDG